MDLKKKSKTISSILQAKRQKHKPKYELGNFVSTPDDKKVFTKIYTTKWSYKLNTITEKNYDTFPLQTISYLPER